MRARARFFALAGAIGVAAMGATVMLGSACAPQGQMGAIGSSAEARGDRGAGEHGGGAGDGGAAVVSPVPRDFRAAMASVSGGRFLSKGHAGGRWDAEIYANDAGVVGLESERGPMPVGAQFIEAHFERADGGASGPVMMMEKRSAGFDPAGGDWRYVAVGARGDVAKDGAGGAVDGCGGCHGEAPGDHVFRVTAAR